jgi:hypothetical protein
VTNQMMTQRAPYPTVLKELVESLRYRRGWTFELLDDHDREQGSVGLTLRILALVENSVGDYSGMEEGQKMRVSHTFIVPAASYNRTSWMRWLLDCVLKVETHEACEYFRINEERVYAPHHSEGEDPYIIWQIGDYETAKKTSRDA